MTTYEIEFPVIGFVKVQKKRGMKSLRLRILPDGNIMVSAPWHVPKSVVTHFISQRSEWIQNHREDYSLKHRTGLKFGHNLCLELSQSGSRNHSRLVGNTLKISLKKNFSPDDQEQKKYIQARMIAAMQSEAENILLPALYKLSTSTGHEFNQAFVKRLSSRWGSCDQNKNITLNVYLLQLPQELQQYVMLHELTHTRHMNHSKKFWDHMKLFMPEVQRLKKELKVHHPRIEERI